MHADVFTLLVLVATIVSSTTCLVGAEKESVWMRRVDCSDKGGHRDGPARYLRASKNEGADGEKEERDGFSLNRLKALFRFNSSTVKQGQLAAKLADTETKKVATQKVVSEIGQTKFTGTERESLQKAASDAAKGKLTPNDVKNIKKTVSEVAEKHWSWSEYLKVAGGWLLFLAVVGWFPAVAYIKRDEIYGSD